MRTLKQRSTRGRLVGGMDDGLPLPERAHCTRSLVPKTLSVTSGPYMPADVCVGTDGAQEQGAVQDVQELGDGGVGAEESQRVQIAMDAAFAEQLHQGGHDGAADTCSAPSHGLRRSQAAVRSDENMKALLQTLDPPHFVHEAKTHGQHNCLIDSVLLALQDQNHIRPLALAERAAICSSIRFHLIENHGVAPHAPDGTHSFLAHEDHFHAICEQLRSGHPGVWRAGVDAAGLSIVAVVSDRFQRSQMFDNHGALEEELEDINEPIISAPQSVTADAFIQLYCNTCEDGHGTPYHYEWISSRPMHPVEAGCL